MDFREATSRVINILKLNNKDEHTSRRYVLHLLRTTAKTLISQKLLDRTITHDNNLYSIIPCFEFEKIDVVKCPLIEFRMCKTLMKSVKPLPELVFSRLGASIKDIVAIDGEYRFTLVDKAQYQRNKKRKHSIKGETYIYLHSDMYLYIPDDEIYSVDLNILTLKTEELYKYSACNEEECESYWNAPFICPDKLLETTFAQVLQTLGITKQSRDDQNPNFNEGT